MRTVTGQRRGCYLAFADPGEDRQDLAEPVLELRSISKSFGAIRALSDVDVSLEPGEVLGLMGDNGAGKSTLVRIMAGNFAPTTGEMRLGGTPVGGERRLFARKPAAEEAGASFMDARRGSVVSVPTA